MPAASARCQQPPAALHQLGSRVGKALAPADRVCRALAVSSLTRKRAFSAVVRAALVRCRRFRRHARNQRPCARAHRPAVIPFPVPRPPAPTLLRPVLSSSHACQSPVPLRPAAIPFCACRPPRSFTPCCPASVRFLHRRTAVAWQIRNAI